MALENALLVVSAVALIRRPLPKLKIKY